MIIYLYIFHENSLLTLEIICLISTLYIIIYLVVYYYFFIALFLLCCFNVGYRQYQSHALNKLSVLWKFPILYAIMCKIKSSCCIVVEIILLLLYLK